MEPFPPHTMIVKLWTEDVKSWLCSKNRFDVSNGRNFDLRCLFIADVYLTHSEVAPHVERALTFLKPMIAII